MIVSSSNHTKPFVIALGIAFTILTFSILGFALMNGGLDFRSKAAVGKCRRATLVNGKYSCLGKGEMLQGTLCCPIVNTTNECGPCGKNGDCSQGLVCQQTVVIQGNCDASRLCNEPDKRLLCVKPGGSSMCLLTPTPSACPKDAKICPDGIVLRRTGPNCEFTSCPKPKETRTPTWRPTPTPTPTPSSGSKMYYCVKPVNGLPFCKQTTAFYTNDAACQANVIAYGDEGNTGTCYTSLKSCKSACR